MFLHRLWAPLTTLLQNLPHNILILLHSHRENRFLKTSQILELSCNTFGAPLQNPNQLLMPLPLSGSFHLCYQPSMCQCRAEPCAASLHMPPFKNLSEEFLDLQFYLCYSLFTTAYLLLKVMKICY